jgi:hypothetical protein
MCVCSLLLLVREVRVDHDDCLSFGTDIARRDGWGEDCGTLGRSERGPGCGKKKSDFSWKRSKGL